METPEQCIKSVPREEYFKVELLTVILQLYHKNSFIGFLTALPEYVEDL